MENVLNINIIGNGFDKMHRVNSTYSDFLGYCETEYSGKENSIYLGMQQEQENNSWVDCELYLNRLFNGFGKFKNEQLNVDVDDADVTTFINYAVNKYDKIVRTLPANIRGEPEFFTLGELINNKANNNWNHIDYSFEPTNEKFVIDNGTGLRFLLEKTEQALLDEFYELKQILTEYLKAVENDFEKNEKFMDKVFLPMQETTEVTLNFNYTNTGESYFNNIYHLHGNLIDENIVWGYYGCTSENICKDWQVLCVNAGSNFKKNISESLQNAKKININIIGHSVCENDYKIYNWLLDEIECSINSQLDEDNQYPVTIHYSYFDSERNSGKDQMKVVKNLRNLNSNVVENAINTGQFMGHNTKYEF